ncbi:hypothetical protein ES319_A04G143200v1 [Gossypium barbadense]|uniref:Uncharacterized protein n=2 Tax=Gossypium TaxID=3633 RepID=A0A5J5W9M4_GOSBA|nr:hypothetical protein ES319_A04G143200v1 [Gossypium barbadense]TYH22809.1 hypothetical protein ES288_A04G159500v1 [Gossypium darwinii]
MVSFCHRVPFKPRFQRSQRESAAQSQDIARRSIIFVLIPHPNVRMPVARAIMNKYST